tara:strand:- start:677 stop:1291 length:615 start_codon:yes stop_codon:yes gene_type:complete
MESDFWDTEGLIALALVFGSPLVGWLFRWLISGELEHLIPQKKNFLKALPIDGNYGVAFILLSIISFLTLHSLIDYDKQRQWERDVFGGYCKVNDGNDERVLGYFKKPEAPPTLEEYYTEEELNDYYKEKPIYCSHYLEKDAYGETLCTWNEGSNANSAECLKLKDNPKPSSLLDAAVANIFGMIVIFYALMLIRLFANLREKE